MVYIHSAENLNSDSSQCNPYCILFNNRKKVRVHCCQIVISFLFMTFLITTKKIYCSFFFNL